MCLAQIAILQFYLVLDSWARYRNQMTQLYRRTVCSRGVVTKLHWLYYDDGWAQLRINRCIASLMDFQRSLLSNSTSEDSLSRFVGNSDFSRDSGKREENQIVRETFENWNIFSLPFEYSFLHVYRPPVYHILSR